MSKGNRIKGKFNQVLGCRESSWERSVSLEERKMGLLPKHKPTYGKNSSFKKYTKAQRKQMRQDKLVTLDKQVIQTERVKLAYQLLVNLVSRAKNYSTRRV